MAVYRKKLVDKDGNTIIPAIGDIYGPVYTASLSSASGGVATYTFTPDTPVEASRVYAVKFPAPTVNNATIILGDGVSSGSILVPPVAATGTPNYELLDTTMINDTEPLLLMYNGVQWVCLNQKNKVATADLEDNAVKSAKIDFATFLNKVFTYSGTRTTTGTFITVPAGKYLLVWHARFSTSGTQEWASVVISHGGTSFTNRTASCFIINDGHTPVVGQSAVITASSDEAIALKSINTSGSILLQSCNLSIFGIKS